MPNYDALFYCHLVKFIFPLITFSSPALHLRPLIIQQPRPNLSSLSCFLSPLFFSNSLFYFSSVSFLSHPSLPPLRFYTQLSCFTLLSSIYNYLKFILHHITSHPSDEPPNPPSSQRNTSGLCGVAAFPLGRPWHHQLCLALSQVSFYDPA